MGPSRGAGRAASAREEYVRDDEGAVPVAPAARKRVAVETYVRNEANLRRTAIRYSICEDDAEEALARGLEILLAKAPSEDPRELVRWTQTVIKHEALSVRAERERVLAGPAALSPDPGREDWVSMLPAEADGPPELAERHEAVERSREALATLKPQELRALTLLAEGYSYREIGDITGYSSTKVNRCVAEGRERFRRFLVRREGGALCTELAPLLSAFADDEAGAADVATLRGHLRGCPYCRATLRTYRAAPRAAAALAPLLPLPRGSLVERIHDAYVAVATRMGGGGGASDSTLGGLAASGGTRGAGVAALAKVLAACAGTVGGAAACVATGVLPAPLIASPNHSTARPAAKVIHHPRHRQAEDLETSSSVEYETENAPIEAEPDPQPQESGPPDHHDKPKPEGGEATPVEAVVESTPPPSESGATEYTEPAPPPAAPVESSSPAPTTSSSSASSSASAGTAAGEFGP